MLLFTDDLVTALKTDEVIMLLFTDDLVTALKTDEELQSKTLLWQKCFQKRGVKMSAKKTEVMPMNKEGKQIHIEDKNGQKLNQVNRFNYLGAILKQNGGCEVAIAEKIRLPWQRGK